MKAVITIDPGAQLQKLLADVDDLHLRIHEQRKADPDHEVALAMYGADLHRAILRVTQHQTRFPELTLSRRYEDGRRVA